MGLFGGTNGARGGVWGTKAVAAMIAGLLALLLSADGFAQAETFADVPIPRPRPDNAPTATATAETEAMAQAEAPRAPAFKVSASSRFTPAQQQALAGISNYFNGFRTMEGQFIQFGPNGEQSEGVFFIAKPGKIRFHYRPPVKLDVIADGKTVAVRDNRTMTQDYYPLSKTPLRYLLSESVDLTSDKLVSEIREEPDLIAVVIVEKTRFVQGKLTLIFDRKSLELKQWIVTDAQGLNTSVAIYNIATGKSPDPGLFKITYMGLPNAQ